MTFLRNDDDDDHHDDDAWVYVVDNKLLWNCFLINQQETIYYSAI